MSGSEFWSSLPSDEQTAGEGASFAAVAQQPSPVHDLYAQMRQQLDDHQALMDSISSPPTPYADAGAALAAQYEQRGEQAPDTSSRMRDVQQGFPLGAGAATSALAPQPPPGGPQRPVGAEGEAIPQIDQVGETGQNQGAQEQPYQPGQPQQQQFHSAASLPPLPGNRTSELGIGDTTDSGVAGVQAGLGDISRGVQRSIQDVGQGAARLGTNTRALGAALAQGDVPGMLGSFTQMGLGAADVAMGPLNLPGHIVGEGVRGLGGPEPLAEAADFATNFVAQGGPKGALALARGVRNLPATARALSVSDLGQAFLAQGAPAAAAQLAQEGLGALKALPGAAAAVAQALPDVARTLWQPVMTPDVAAGIVAGRRGGVQAMESVDAPLMDEMVRLYTVEQLPKRQIAESLRVPYAAVSQTIDAAGVTRPAALESALARTRRPEPPEGARLDGGSIPYTKLDGTREWLDRSYEAMMAHLLDGDPDVAWWTGSLGKDALVPYLKADGGIGVYHPDFMVISAIDGSVEFIEIKNDAAIGDAAKSMTAGGANLNVMRKAEAGRTWAANLGAGYRIFTEDQIGRDVLRSADPAQWPGLQGLPAEDIATIRRWTHGVRASENPAVTKLVGDFNAATPFPRVATAAKYGIVSGGGDAPAAGAGGMLSGVPEPRPGQRLPAGYVFHNTKAPALASIEREGLSAGSFTDRPIDFGGDVWIAVRKDELPNVESHDYGGVQAHEPDFEIGRDAEGFPIEQAIPPERLYLVDRRGRVIRRLGAGEATAVGGSTSGIASGGAVPPPPGIDPAAWQTQVAALDAALARAPRGDEAGITSGRFYHGTGTTFGVPEGAKFDAGGLYGPAYYLTDNPQVASSYAEGRAATLEDEVRHVQYFLDQAQRKAAMGDAAAAANVPGFERELAALQERGAQVRPVDVPGDLRLLDAEARLSEYPDLVATLRERIPPRSEVGRSLLKMTEGGRWTIDDLYTHLADPMLTGAKPAANSFLAAAGYDGIRYPGGRIMPIADDAGNAVTHTALAIFPEALPKLRNALSGQPGGIVSGGTGAAPDTSFAALLRGAAGHPTVRPGDLLAGRVGAVAGGVAGATGGPPDQSPGERVGRTVEGALFGGLTGIAGAQAVRGVRAGAQAVAPILAQLDRLGRMGVLPAAEEEAGRLRASIEQRAAAWDQAQQQLGRLQAEIEQRAGSGASVGAVERPAWAAASGGRRAMTDAELADLAERSGVNPYEPQWYQRLDPATVRAFQQEVVSSKTGTSQTGQTPGQARAHLAALRRQATALQSQLRTFEREMNQDFTRVSVLEERAGREPFPFEPTDPATDAAAAGGPAAAAGAPDSPLWVENQRLQAELAAARVGTSTGRRPAAGGLAGPRGEPLSTAPTEPPPFQPSRSPSVFQPTSAEQPRLLGPDGRPLPSTPSTAPPQTYGALAAQVRAIRSVDDHAAAMRGIWEAERTGQLTAEQVADLEAAAEAQVSGVSGGPLAGRGAQARALADLQPAASPIEAPALRQEMQAAQTFRQATRGGVQADAQAAKDAAAAAPPPPRPTVLGVPRPTLAEAAGAMQSGPLAAPSSLLQNALSGAFRTVQRVVQESVTDPLGTPADLNAMRQAIPDALATAVREFRAGPSAALNRGLAPEAGGLEHSRRLVPTLLTAGVRGNVATDRLMANVNAAGATARAARQGLSEPDAAELAGQAADFATYRGQPSPLATALSAGRKWVDDPQAPLPSRAAGAVLMALAPYVRTPERVLLASIGLATDPFTQPFAIARAVRAGNGPALREGIGRLVLGTTLDIWLAWEAAHGTLHGDPPRDQAQRRRMEADGVQWNTLHGVPLRNYGTFGDAASAIATTVAATQDAMKQGKPGGEAAQAGVDGALRWTLNKSYVRDLARFAQDWSEGRGSQAVVREAAGLATRPIAPLTNLVGAADPYERKTSSAGIKGELLSTLPGGRYALPVQQNELGQPLLRGGTGLSRAFGQNVPGGPQGPQIRRYVGSSGAEQDAEIAAALSVVHRYQANPQANRKPTSAERQLFAVFSTRENPGYLRARQAELDRQRRAALLSGGAR